MRPMAAFARPPSQHTRVLTNANTLAAPHQLRWLAVPSTCQHTRVLANAKTLAGSPAARASPGGSNNAVALHVSLSFYYIDNALYEKS